jgi:hypothetical protein
MSINIEYKNMKALSIIGIILSVIGVINSLIIINTKSYYDSNIVLGPGILSLIITTFFLAFSISATAVSCRKKVN